MPQSFERRNTHHVVRLWVEPMQWPGEPRWRGQIEHVGSGEKTHFEVPAVLLEFIAQHLWGF